MPIESCSVCWSVNPYVWVSLTPDRIQQYNIKENMYKRHIALYEQDIPDFDEDREKRKINRLCSGGQFCYNCFYKYADAPGITEYHHKPHGTLVIKDGIYYIRILGERPIDALDTDTIKLIFDDPIVDENNTYYNEQRLIRQCECCFEWDKGLKDVTVPCVYTPRDTRISRYCDVCTEAYNHTKKVTDVSK